MNLHAFAPRLAILSFCGLSLVAIGCQKKGTKSPDDDAAAEESPGDNSPEEEESEPGTETEEEEAPGLGGEEPS
jgi:hypothetical protein